MPGAHSGTGADAHTPVDHHHGELPCLPARARAAVPTSTGLPPTVRPCASGLRAKTSSMRWPSITQGKPAGRHRQSRTRLCDRRAKTIQRPAEGRRLAGHRVCQGSGRRTLCRQQQSRQDFRAGTGPAERKAPTKAMCSTPRSSRAGDARNSVAPAMWICSRAAATSTTPTATGVRGSKLT